MTKVEIGSTWFDNLKSQLISNCGVAVPTEHFDAQAAITKRLNYLKFMIKKTGRKGFVLGISGGVDSTTVGKLCQVACEDLRNEGVTAKFIAMRLPSDIQADEADAQAALSFINPDRSYVINVGEAANSMMVQNSDNYISNEDFFLSDHKFDFIKGNTKARLRMIAQYQTAAMYDALVIGTDHNAEYATGFFTKWGDGACDLTVLNGLNKRQVRLVAKALGAPEFLYAKAPTADLEELNPGKLDDEGFGFPYDVLDDYLEGKAIDPEIELKILQLYADTQHKRLPIPGFLG